MESCIGGGHQPVEHVYMAFLPGRGGLIQLPAPLFLGSLCGLFNKLKNLGRFLSLSSEGCAGMLFDQEHYFIKRPREQGTYSFS